jgi:hypothetical protein
MNWKKFLAPCISAALLCFPYNIIGCAGGDPDPYDYFISFFDNNLPASKAYTSFYYTNHEFLYNHNEKTDAAVVAAGEWCGYAGKSFDAGAAYDFVSRFAWKDLNNLYYHLEEKKPLQIPDSVKNNPVTAFFMQSRDFEALGYIMYAKQVEPQVTGEWREWEPLARDKAKMDKLIKNGQQLYKAAKKDYIKLRYAYQLLRLAHYSGRYADCRKWYDDMVTPNKTSSVLQDLCLSLKAGAQMRLGEKTKAAYTFSRLFSTSEIKRVSNYMSFDWCVKRFDAASRAACLKECKNSAERADMLALFAMGSHVNELKVLNDIAAINAAAPVLEVLTTREVNKMEEYYFTNDIRKKQAGSNDFYFFDAETAEADMKRSAAEIPGLIAFCNKAAQSGGNKTFYKLAAAHLAFITKDYKQSEKYLAEAEKNLSGK